MSADANLMNSLAGSCHCKAVQVSALLKTPPEQLPLRKCDCSFCVRHGAAYFSDAGGSFEISSSGDSLHHYRQYAGGIAEFLVCRSCGVLVGVIHTDKDGKLYGALNGLVFLNHKFAAAVPISPENFTADQKRERWKQIWFSDVSIRHT